MKKSEMWARRIISTLLLLAIAAGLVWLVIWLVGFFVGKNSDFETSMSASAKQETLDISACKASALRTRIVAKPEFPGIGESTEFTLTVRNTENEDCQLDASDLRLRISNGDDVIWNPIECTDAWDKPLLLSKDLTWSGKVTWDGKVYDKCKPVQFSDNHDLVADAGNYRAYVDYSGAQLERPLNLQIGDPEVEVDDETYDETYEESQSE